jgi:hypothetical protein
MIGGDLRWMAKRTSLELLRALPDSIAVSLDYFRVFGTLPNLAAPRRFSEGNGRAPQEARRRDLPLLIR